MRLKRILISKEYFEGVLKADFFHNPFLIVSSNAPKDMQVVGFRLHEGSPVTFEAFVTSETFDDLPENAEPPELYLTYSVKQLPYEEKLFP